MLTWRPLLLGRDAFLDLPRAIQGQRGALAVCRGNKQQAGDHKAVYAQSAPIVAPQDLQRGIAAAKNKSADYTD
jgi:hypothetical protein